MKKRVWIGLGVALAALCVVVLVLPTSHFRLLGWLRREAFYNGWPTSYWVAAFKKDAFLAGTSPPADVGHALAQGGAAAVPVLVEMMGDGDPEIRTEALLALSVMGRESTAAAPALVEILVTDKDPAFVERVVQVLRQVDRQAAVTALAEALRDRKRPPPLRENPVRTDRFGDPLPEGRAGAVRALGGMGPEAIGPLGEALRDDELQVRVEAARALGQIGQEKANSTGGLLGEGLRVVGLKIFVDAVRALGQTSREKAKDPVRPLGQALRDADLEVRVEAARALRAMGREARDALGPLGEALRDDELQVRVEAASALWHIDGQVEPLIPVLLDGIKSKGQASATALDVFHSMGWNQKGNEAIPALLNTLGDPDAEVSHHAAKAINSLHPTKKAAPVLLVALKDASPKVRRSAAHALGKTRAGEAIPALVAALKDEEQDVRTAAADALGDMDPREAVPPLIEALKDKELRRMAAVALGRLGPGAKAAVPALTEALKDEDVDKELRRMAAAALGHIGPGAKAAVPALTAALKDEDVLVRVYAADSLWWITHQAGPVLPVLRAVAEDNGADVRARRVATWALQAMEQPTEAPDSSAPP